MSTSSYKGRFAPSPTGPLHFGSLVAAVASYLQARCQGGQWFLRIEDLDPPREPAGASQHIIETLRDFGFEWDGEIVFQSQRHAAYLAALDSLAQAQWVYPCSCSRKQVAEHGLTGAFGAIYPGSCRQGPLDVTRPLALRIRCSDERITFKDAIYGAHSSVLSQELGDFVLRRADGLFAYQLAVVVDDAEAGITEVVRGSDLLDNTARQIHLQQCLGLATPHYVHLPLVLNHEGQKLSKQTFAPALKPSAKQALLVAALEFLGQACDSELKKLPLLQIWDHAIKHWSLARVEPVNQALSPIIDT